LFLLDQIVQNLGSDSERESSRERERRRRKEKEKEKPYFSDPALTVLKYPQWDASRRLGISGLYHKYINLYPQLCDVILEWSLI
jgi:hypothetical protein